MLNFKQKLNKITTLMFDVDGVMTDGKVLVMESGEMVRNMNSKDGYAIHLAVQKAFRIVIISGGNNNAVKNALERTGVKDVFINQHDKLACYLDYLKLNNLKDEEVLFMGDDLPDHEIMSRVAWPFVLRMQLLILNRSANMFLIRMVVKVVYGILLNKYCVYKTNGRS
ncbi:MAG: 3-deoxy-D-manno-octulosonate 8-phosphate phosphatase [Bacteroidia bacterium]